MTKVLYVEDDAFVARTVKRQLENDGYIVTLSEEGTEGLELCQSGAFDVILLDHMLPGIEGVEILRQLAPDLPCPVIMVSGASDLVIAVEAMRIGAADYVIKETDGSYIDLLAQTIARVLAHEKLLRDKEEADARIAAQAETIQAVLDNMDPGVSLLDSDLNLVSFNDRFIALFDLHPGHIKEGISLGQLLDEMSRQGDFGTSLTEIKENIAVREALYRSPDGFLIDHARPDGRFIEIRGGAMPDGGYIASYTDITERKRMEQELRRLATTDPLTGVNNRRQFTELSERELSRCKRYKHAFCALILDADHFKSVNDTYGHEVGDRVLKALAATCLRELRDVDVFGRFGGEEFTVCLPETSIETALDAAERLRIAIADTKVETDQGDNLSFTVSIGAAELQKESETLPDILARADAALYQAKEAGRNRVISA